MNLNSTGASESGDKHGDTFSEQPVSRGGYPTTALVDVHPPRFEVVIAAVVAKG